MTRNVGVRLKNVRTLDVRELGSSRVSGWSSHAGVLCVVSGVSSGEILYYSHVNRSIVHMFRNCVPRFVDLFVNMDVGDPRYHCICYSNMTIFKLQLVISNKIIVKNDHTSVLQRICKN